MGHRSSLIAPRLWLFHRRSLLVTRSSWLLACCSILLARCSNEVGGYFRPLNHFGKMNLVCEHWNAVKIHRNTLNMWPCLQQIWPSLATLWISFEQLFKASCSFWKGFEIVLKAVENLWSISKYVCLLKAVWNSFEQFGDFCKNNEPWVRLK